MTLTAEDGRRVLPQRVVQTLQDFTSSIAALTEVLNQELLQNVPVQDVWDAPQQHHPRTNLHLHLEARTAA